MWKLCVSNKCFYKVIFTKYCYYCDQMKADNTLRIMKDDNLTAREILKI